MSPKTHFAAVLLALLSTASASRAEPVTKVAPPLKG
ncbi:MAG: hypothetical protein JWM74_1253, partial [Myxococcaceae bacterium]|nr:hypothetical protein [Myxococcaceae bacterium]